MSTNKFKVGDRVRCVVTKFNRIKCGRTYIIHKVEGAWYYVTTDDGYSDAYLEYVFELMVEAQVLTPEAVLQYFKEKRQGELECIQPNGLVLDNMNEYTSVKYIFECKWRVKHKPEPEIITLNGKRYQALED